MIEKIFTGKSHEPSSRTKEVINTKINKFKDFTEVIVFAENFDVWYGKHEHKFVDTETGEIATKDKLREARLELLTAMHGKEYAETKIDLDGFRSKAESRKRAKDNFYGFALCNDWLYFCTFTVAKNDFESDDKATKYYWQLFREKLQRKFPDIKIRLFAI